MYEICTNLLIGDYPPIIVAQLITVYQKPASYAVELAHTANMISSNLIPFSLCILNEALYNSIMATIL